MPAGTFTLFDKAKLNITALGLLSASNTFKWTLHTSTYVPGQATNEVYADLANELATGNGYTAGGLALPSNALTLASGTVKFTGNPAQWTAAGGSIPAWRTAVLRAVGTIGGKVDPVIGYFVGDTTAGGTDVPATTSGNTLTITPNAAGIVGAS